MVVLGSFYVGVYKYARPVSLYYWIVVFRVAYSVSNEIQRFIEAISDAAQQAPIFLSMQEMAGYVASVQSQTGVNKKIDSGILQLMMPDRTHLTHYDTAGSKKMLYSDIQHLMIQGDNFNGED